MGRGSALAAFVAAVLLVVLMMAVETGARSSTFIVGGRSGWNFMSNSWPSNKHFKAGDYLVFKYDSSYHNVVAVDKLGYKSCHARTGRSKTYQSGNDRFRLRRGMNYFICSIPTHCTSGGMKIAARAY